MLQNVLQKQLLVMEERGSSKCSWTKIVWIVHYMYQFLTWSFSTTVLEKYGNGGEDQLIFLVPSTQQTLVFVDRIEGMHIF